MSVQTLMEDPRFKGALALLALITCLSFIDDVVMIVSFWMDGDYWAFAGRLSVFIVIGSAVLLLWRTAQRYLQAMLKEAEAAEEADRPNRCPSHPSYGTFEGLRDLAKEQGMEGACMCCWLEELDRRTRHV